MDKYNDRYKKRRDTRLISEILIGQRQKLWRYSLKKCGFNFLMCAAWLLDEWWRASRQSFKARACQGRFWQVESPSELGKSGG
ncbi:hypothetical protein TNCV_4160831 [Trichonephila clavipes]|nr:hypothetical protein TNCV_4160831 [Trichonephila clavipes]